MADLGGANKDILKRQLQILRKPPDQRTPEDVKAFAASLSKTKFFQDLGENDAWHLISMRMLQQCFLVPHK